LFKLIFTTLLFAQSLTLAADLAPTLQWVKTAGGSGIVAVSGSAVDAQGNLYITGATTSTDLSSPSAPVRAPQDVYVMKLNPNGEIVYLTYFGGSGNEEAAALALGPGGSVFIAGASNSADLPVTAGTYNTTPPTKDQNYLSFILKLDASGKKEWATYFAIGASSIAVDSSGSPYVAGSTGGNGAIPTTPGAYNSDFKQTFTSNGFFSIPGPTSAFVTKFDPRGAALVYSTYVPTDREGNVVQEARALAVDSAGNAWIGAGAGNSLAAGDVVRPSVVELNSTGTDIIASASSAGLGSVAAIAFDADSNVYVAGEFLPPTGFPASVDAFQPFTQPIVTALSGQPQGGYDAFVGKWDHGLTHLLAATLLGGELTDAATSIAIDPSGNVIVGGFTDSKAFPTRAPFQTSFSSHSGFAAALDSSLSKLLFSTYIGDTRQFSTQGVLPDGSGNLLVAGVTLFRDEIGAMRGDFIVANKIALAPAPTPRLDSIQHYVSRLANPLAPGEPMIAAGSGFAAGARLILDGSPLATIGSTDTWLVAVVPDSAATLGAHTLQISNNGTLSNVVFVPAAPASPGIYTTTGAPAGEAYVTNSDGSLNSASNPALPGSAITIYAAGAGPFTRVGPYAVTSLLPAVFIDGFYCNGIAATIEPFDGLPGNVFKLSVTIPSYADLLKLNPDLRNYKFPAQSSLKLQMGASVLPPISQNGIYVSIKP
jgi:uncharacterized protein (TIGR03437 family)